MIATSTYRGRFAAISLFALGVLGSGCHGCGGPHRRVDPDATAKCASSQTQPLCEACCKRENDRGHEHKGPNACTCIHRD